MTTDTREALAALVAAHDALQARQWPGGPAQYEQQRDELRAAWINARAALAAQAAQPSAQGEAVARIDPMQNPMRPGVFMNYAKDETPAEMVLRKLACWLGVGGYNATTVDAEAFHRKIVEGVQMLVASASAPAAPAQAVPLTDEQADALRFRWLCEHPDWHFVEDLCRQFVAETNAEFLREMRRVIDARLSIELGPFEEHIAPKAAQETKA